MFCVVNIQIEMKFDRILSTSVPISIIIRNMASENNEDIERLNSQSLH